MGNLSAISDDERSTLERLGHADNTRMACCCRVEGPVEVALTPDKAGGPTPSQILRMSFDRSIERVVVLGNGIAGVTAADHVRRRHPECRVGSRGRRAAPALQPHGHQPPDLRPLGDGGALPQPRRLVRRAPDRDVAEHARRRDRPGHERGRARHRRAARLRPADPRAGLERDGAADRRLRRPRHVRGPQRRGRALDPRVRAARVVPRGADRGRRPARARGRLRAAQARPARLDPRALRPAAAAPARRARVAVPAALPRGPGHEHRHARGDRGGFGRRAPERGAAARRPRAARRPAARVRGHHAERDARARGGARGRPRRRGRRHDAHERPADLRGGRRRRAPRARARAVAGGGRAGRGGGVRRAR